MTAELSYHGAHEPYTGAVAAALKAAGIEPHEWWADANDPRDSCIVLKHRDEDGDQVVVGWTEERGWMYGSGPADKGLTLIAGICHEVLPSPAEVVEEVTKCLAGQFGHADDYKACYRTFEDQGDGFEARLAAYHPGPQAEQAIAARSQGEVQAQP